MANTVTRVHVAADLAASGATAHLILGAATSSLTALSGMSPDDPLAAREQGMYDAFILALGFALKGAHTNSDYEDAIRSWIEGSVA